MLTRTVKTDIIPNISSKNISLVGFKNGVDEFKQEIMLPLLQLINLETRYLPFCSLLTGHECLNDFDQPSQSHLPLMLQTRKRMLILLAF